MAQRLTPYLHGCARVLRALTLFCLLLVAVLIVQSTVLQGGHILRPRPPQRQSGSTPTSAARERQEMIEGSQVTFQVDGTLHFLRVSGEKWTVRDRDLRPIWRGKRHKCPFGYLQFTTRPHPRFSSILTLRRLHEGRLLGPLLSKEATAFMDTGRDRLGRQLEVWRYLPSVGLFEGFDAQGHRVGYLGAEGFSEDRRDAVGLGRFVVGRVVNAARDSLARDSLGRATPWACWVTEDQLYTIGFRTRTVHAVLSPPQRIVGLQYRPELTARPPGYHPLAERPGLLAVETEDGMHHVFLPSPPRRELIGHGMHDAFWPLRRERRTLRLIDSAGTPVRGLLAYQDDRLFVRVSQRSLQVPDTFATERARRTWPDEARGRSYTFSEALYEIDEGGRATEVTRFEWEHARPAPRSRDTGGFEAVVRAFSPLLLRAVEEPVGDLRVWRTHPVYAASWEVMGPWEIIRVFTHEAYPTDLRLAGIVAAVLGAICLVHGRRRSMGPCRLAAWVMSVVLLGPAALLTYLSLNHTSLVRCRQCRRRYSPALASCPGCGVGAAWAPGRPLVGAGRRPAEGTPGQSALAAARPEESVATRRALGRGRPVSPVMALVRKELWECGPWLIVVGLVVLGLGTMEVLGLARTPAERWLQAPRTSWHGFQKPCLSTVGLQLLTASLALGPILAIRQFFVPSVSGEWGFGLHRPVSRARLLTVKAATAVLGAGIALGGAWAIVFWHASWPGVIWLPPPPEQLCEGWHHVVWGIPAYLGTALACTSTARWHGTRLFGALFAAVGALWVFSGGSQVGSAAVVCGISAGVLLVVLAHTFLRREF